MPSWPQVGAEASPIRHYIELVSGLFMKRAGISELWPHAIALAAMIILLLFASGWFILRRAW